MFFSKILPLHHRFINEKYIAEPKTGPILHSRRRTERLCRNRALQDFQHCASKLVQLGK